MKHALFALSLVTVGCARDVSQPRPRQPPPVAVARAVMTERPPPSRRSDVVESIHGVAVPDPYRWLEDPRSPEVKQWLEAQDAYARRYLDRAPERPDIVARLKALMYIGDVEATTPRRGRYFFRRREPGQEKHCLYVRDSASGPERVLVDPNAWPSEPRKVFRGYWPSRDGKHVAIAIAKNDSDDGGIEIIDSRDGRTVETVDGARYDTISWSADGFGVYYTWYPAGASGTFANSEVRFHTLGKDATKDVVISPATGLPDVEQYVLASPDGRWLVLHKATGWRKTDLYFASTRAPKAWRPLVVGRDARYSAAPYKDKLYIWTNDGAPHYRMLRADPARPDRGSWEEIIPERSDATLEYFDIVGDHLVLRWLKEAAHELEIRRVDGAAPMKVTLPGAGLVSQVDGLEDDDEGFFRYESHIQAPRVYRFSAKTGEAALVASVKPPADEDAYVVENVPYRSKDGTRGFVVLMRRKDARRDGSAPMYMMGYGAHGVSVRASYLSSTYAWLEQGGMYARAVVRGGAEYGEEWHRDGMLKNKQHTIDDFVASAEELVRQGWTRPERLVISGVSMGGLLVAAAVTQRPDLFRAGVVELPLADLVRYPLSGAGKRLLNELGDPEKSDEFLALWGYSPYHRVRQGVSYPPMLIMTGDSDDRVDPAHARKLAAALQSSTPSNETLLSVERQQGHHMADTVGAVLKARADKFVFALAKVHASTGAPPRLVTK